MIGTTIGNYVVRRKIGEGGMGVVYLAEHPRIGRKVAIKVLLPQLSQNPEIVSRFFTEARSANEIGNEHIIDIIDFGELKDGSSYFIMEWLDGKSLTDSMVEQPRFSIDRAIHVTRGTGRALAAAHARGIVHRDLKPDNIFLIPREGDPDFVKVLDFGIAKLMQEDASQMAFKTQTGAIIGTPYYMSPEQCRGATKELDHRTDIYSLGVILFQMVTGRLPFDAEGLGDLLLAHMTQPPPSPRTIAQDIPQFVDDVILHALEKDPTKRFARMEDFLGALGDFSGPQRLPGRTFHGTGPAHARSKPEADSAVLTAKRPMHTTLGGSAAESIVRKPKRKSSWALLGGTFLGVGLLSFFVFLLTSRQSQPTKITTVPGASPQAERPAPVLQPVVEPPPPVEAKPAPASESDAGTPRHEPSKRLVHVRKEPQEGLEKRERRVRSKGIGPAMEPITDPDIIK